MLVIYGNVIKQNLVFSNLQGWINPLVKSRFSGRTSKTFPSCNVFFPIFTISPVGRASGCFETFPALINITYIQKEKKRTMTDLSQKAILSKYINPPI